MDDAAAVTYEAVEMAYNAAAVAVIDDFGRTCDTRRGGGGARL